MKVEPYLLFNGRCDEAIEFYKKALNAEVIMLMRFKESPQPCDPSQMPPGSENKVMHATLRIGDSQVMASDGQCHGKVAFEGVSLSVAVSNDAQAERAFNALAEGGKICMPMAKTFFSSRFGMVNDKFGVSWMVIVAQ